ncbi:hypothetical protein GWK47_040824 [Chionoecetes opilio]|uniref:Uncharacterized protein n=1 Tax=Chionoecetes opilio TaxID=41210 RepID=A0A8J4YBQ4_CHIOP|nr:hypothetical protein GWK47_040824 [Chionoecetes opilio]
MPSRPELPPSPSEEQGAAWEGGCVTAGWREVPGGGRHVAVQTDDAEVGRDGSAPEDAPPVYDAVVSKPPSYEFVCGNPPDLSCWEDDAEAGVPMRDACTDCDLPTYAQVTQAPSPV